MSEIRTDTINNASGDNDSGIDLSTNDQVSIKTANTTALTVDASQNVIVSSNEPTLFLKDSNNTNTTRYIKNNAEIFTIGRINDDLSASSVEHLRVDDSGNLLVGTTESNPTSSAVNVVGQSFSATNGIRSTVDQNPSATFNRKTNDGSIVLFRKDGTTVGSIGANFSKLFIASNGNSGIRFRDDLNCIIPCNSDGTNSDNDQNLGQSGVRYNTIFATNSTINTSDRNEKQDIEELSEAEQRVAVVAKGLMRKFRWIDSVAEKGDNARIHFGIIAQDLQDAFTAEGLDASKYAMFCSDTWWELDGEIYQTEDEAPEDATEKTGVYN